MYSKGKHKQNKKAAHRMGENIFKWDDWQGIYLQNIQTVNAVQYQKNPKKPSPKMARSK